jgi:mannose-6-phosphate isomerase-like protein (cupin superfamily)
MDVKSIADVAPIMEHNGTVAVWYLAAPQAMREATEGGFLELINEFEVAGGSAVHPHEHPTHEWYYVTAGRGVMTVGDEDRDVAVGDLVYIPPNVVHSLRPVSGTAPIRCFCFAFGERGIGTIDYTTH